MNSYRVWLRSKPGFYEQYDGKVDVLAENKDAAISRALSTLKNGAFPDRGPAMWTVEKVEEN
jgi:hypothetical protein